MVEQVAQRHIARWPQEKPFPAHPLLRALSLDVILQTLFGSSVSTTALHSELLAMLTITASLTLQEPPLRRLPGWRASWRRFLAHRTVVHQLLSRVLVEIADDPPDLIASLLSARNPDRSAMTQQQVQDNLMSLILAGHETTASELAWALQLLAHNPSVCDTLTSELRRGETSYLAATVWEVLRHRPVFLFAIPRVVRKPLHIAEIMYEPPVHLLGCIHLLHHDPTIYPNPDRFTPERFLGKPPQPRHWLPWGGGRKRCPGTHLATLEMHTVLRAIVTEMSIAPAHSRMETARWRSVIVTPSNGCRIILTRRHRSTSLPRGATSKDPPASLKQAATRLNQERRS
jgi:cytochrome P450